MVSKIVVIFILFVIVVYIRFFNFWSMVSFKTGFLIAILLFFLSCLSLVFILKIAIVPCIVAIHYLLFRYVKSKYARK
ncbi:Hypothetical protein CHV_e0029 [Cardinium endosymbiont cBtQ1 of Bemisia tabaci]|nr:Hypothetical protein CHV_e0029 [Cardinium endosymbiont cBtQ1 of Bemisia tabaci]